MPPPIFRPVVYRVTVSPELAGERLDKALARLLPELSRRRLREILNRGGVWEHDQRFTRAEAPVTEGQVLTVLHPPGFVYPTVSITEGHVLWEDSDLLALNKQPDWYVQATAWDRFGNVESALVDFLRERGDRNPRLHLIHRLDRETSGVLLVSKAPRINRHMQRLWSERKVEKRYRFLTRGRAPEAWASDEPLGPGPGGKHRIDGAAGKPAHTDFRTIGRGEASGVEYSEVEAVPLTGRTHQIRIHAAHSGFPIIGDTRYEGPDIEGASRTMLHAAQLKFRHPLADEDLDLLAEPPEDYRLLAASLDLGAAGGSESK